MSKTPVVSSLVDARRCSRTALTAWCLHMWSAAARLPAYTPSQPRWPERRMRPVLLDSRDQIASARSGGDAITIEALLALRRPSEAVCSPDGSRIAIAVQDPPSSSRPGAASGAIWIAEGDDLIRATDTGG